MSLFAGQPALSAPSDPLVSQDDFTEWYSLTDVTTEQAARIQTALEIASAQIRNGRRVFSPVTGEVELIDGNMSMTLLLSRYHLPVTNVSQVEEYDGNAYNLVDAAEYQWTADGIVERIGWRSWRGGIASVRVTYDHGYTTLPRDVAGVCLSLAKRLYDNPDSTSVQSEQLGDHHVTYQGATGGISPLEESQLRLYESNHA